VQGRPAVFFAQSPGNPPTGPVKRFVAVSPARRGRPMLWPSASLRPQPLSESFRPSHFLHRETWAGGPRRQFGRPPPPRPPPADGLHDLVRVHRANTVNPSHSYATPPTIPTRTFPPPPVSTQSRGPSPMACFVHSPAFRPQRGKSWWKLFDQGESPAVTTFRSPGIGTTPQPFSSELFSKSFHLLGSISSAPRPSLAGGPSIQSRLAGEQSADCFSRRFPLRLFVGERTASLACAWPSPAYGAPIPAVAARVPRSTSPRNQNQGWPITFRVCCCRRATARNRSSICPLQTGNSAPPSINLPDVKGPSCWRKNLPSSRMECSQARRFPPAPA